MKIGDEVYIHGYVDEIRKDTVIIRNDGGYFGTVKNEVIFGAMSVCKKGKWIKEPYMNFNDTWAIRCSECMKVGSVGSGKGFSFCPHCGACMRGDEDDG